MADAPKPAPKPEAKYEPPKELPQAAAVQKFQGRPKRQPVEQAEFFYNVKGTHIAFFVSSAGLLISFLMMFHKDVDRPWKPYQKQFAEMDFEKLWVDMNDLEKKTAESQTKIDAIDAKLTQFYGKFEKPLELPAETFGPPPPKVGELDKKLGISFDKVHILVDPETEKKKLYEKKPFVVEKEKIRGELFARTQAMNFAKDDQGAARFRYEDAKHHKEEAQKSGSDRLSFYEHEFEQEEKEYSEVLRKVGERKALYDELQKWDEFYTEFASQLEMKASAVWSGRTIDELKKDRVAIVKDVEEKKTRFEKERPSFANTVRNAPGADFFAPTLKVKQHILLDLKDQLNFAQVTKVDRCDTCHVGIGNPTYEVRIDKELEDDREDKVTFKDQTLRDFVAHARGKVEPDKCLICKGHEGKELKAPLTAHKSWSSDDAIKFTKVFMAHPRLDLFVKDSSKHKLDNVGCTICHEGDGRDTDFTRVVHIPNSKKQGQDWRRRHGTPYGEELYNWNYRELWDLPMFPSKYVQASCRRCHTDAVELDGGEKYVEGMKLVERVGCYGCHRMDTYQILEKDLKNPAIDANRKTRRPGPPLLRIAAKVTPEWASKWVLAPRDFRPTTRMPHFFGQSNTRETVNGKSYPVEEKGGVRRSPVDDTIVGSIVKYVFSLSEANADPAPPGLKGDPIKGEIIVKSVGCIACHKLVETPLSEFQDKPGHEAKRSRFLEEFAPTLFGVGSKMNKAWLYGWVRNPKAHFKDSSMPNLRLSEQEATDVVEYLMTLKKPDWEKLPGPEVNPAIVDDLIREFLRKSMSDFDVEQIVTGKTTSKYFKDLATPDGKVKWLGRKMVKNFGCYSCHQLKTEMEGQEVIFDWQAEEGIGVELTGSQPWGSKHHDKLDYGFTEDDGVNHHGVTFQHGFTKEPMTVTVEPTRQDWLEHKLANPRVFDGGKMASKPWDELLRMPNFALNNREIESIATFVQSFTDHTVAGLVEGAKKRPTGEEMAKYRGDRLVRENNCRACHRFSLDTFVIDWVRDENGKSKRGNVEVEGRFGREEPADVTEGNLRRWKLLGEKEDLKGSGKKLFTYSWTTDHSTLRMSGAVNPDSKYIYFDGHDRYYLDVQGGEVKSKRPVLQWHPQEGGEILAELRKFKRDLSEANKPYDTKAYEPFTDFLDAGNEGEFETRYPPMLRSQGVKTQTDWLFRFLKAPYPIRPTLQPIYPGMKALPDVNLRMPTFDFADEEANSVVRWFAVRDQLQGVDAYPSTEFPERTEEFLKARKAAHDAVGPVVKDQNTGCAGCHYIAGQAPPGAVLKHAPDLAMVQERLRPRWMYEWQADPSQIYPGTTMTQYDFKPLFRKSNKDDASAQRDGVQAAVEYLLNFGKFSSKSSK
ncbi:MAG TPA: multiheme c-type cytochrome [Planctomycetota bacterium]|nr:multiheme c-type cytochrome [Planctomycetota bacterium]